MSKVERRFLKAVRGSGLVPADELERALALQAYAAERGRALPLDRILLKLELLDREQLLGLWRALRYYVWRREDKLYVKVAIQSSLLTAELSALCLKEQKKAYKHDNQLVRVNEIARQRGYLVASEDRAIVRAMREQHSALTILPVEDRRAGEAYEPRSRGAATSTDGSDWRERARRSDLRSLRGELAASSSGERGASDSGERGASDSGERGASDSGERGASDSGERGASDEDLDALWEQADLDDVELDSQAVEIARAPLFEDSDEDDDPF